MTERAFFMCYFRNKTNEWQSKNLITIIKLKNTAHAFRPRTKLPLNMEPLKHSGYFLVGIVQYGFVIIKNTPCFLMDLTLVLHKNKK